MAIKTNCNKTVNGKTYKYARVWATLSNGTQKEFTGKSKKEAEEKKEKYLAGIADGLSFDYNKMCLGELMRLWLFKEVKVTKSTNTFDRYITVFRNYIKDSELFELKIHELKPLTLRRHYNALSKDGKTYSQVFNLNKVLRSFFTFAVREGYLVKNPCSNLSIPKNDDEGKEEISPLSDEEITKIGKCLTNCLDIAFWLDLGTGLRIGELLGLSFSDINIEKHELTVTKALKNVREYSDENHSDYKMKLESPKTGTSLRTVPLPASLIAPLKSYLLDQKKKCIQLGIPYTENRLIFTSETGRPLDSKNVRTAWKRTLFRAGVEYRCFHNIRHTYATKLFEQGVELLTVSRLLGHSNIAITANTYTHVMPKVKNNAAQMLDYLFASKLSQY
ncbi:MAG: site-specific integrase [Clostridiales bacterium]|jgi:integrase|nr:site-specific integrase [Clostridiales bacterium]